MHRATQTLVSWGQGEFKASQEGYEEIGRNSLNAEVFSSPAFSRGRMFIRAATKDGGKRQEYLYCVGSEN